MADVKGICTFAGLLLEEARILALRHGFTLQEAVIGAIVRQGVKSVDIFRTNNVIQAKDERVLEKTDSYVTKKYSSQLFGIYLLVSVE